MSDLKLNSNTSSFCGKYFGGKYSMLHVGDIEYFRLLSLRHEASNRISTSRHSIFLDRYWRWNL